MDPNFAGRPKPSTATGGTFHRRAHSDTMFDIDDIFLDDLVVSELSLDCPQTPLMIPDNGNGSEASRSSAQPIKAHGRSLSVDAGFFEGLLFDAAPAQAGQTTRPGRHVRSSSMDGYNSATSSEVESGGGAKKAMASDRLAELALIDPKRAKRILANRQSAARSKERKIHYTTELERKVQTLQTEATNLSAQITSLQRDATGLTAENKELKLKLQAMEQQAHLRDALNEALGEELKWLRIAAGQAPPNMDRNNNRRSSSSSSLQFTPQPQYLRFVNNQTTQNQQQIARSDPRLGGQPSFQDFSKRAS